MSGEFYNPQETNGEIGTVHGVMLMRKILACWNT